MSSWGTATAGIGLVNSAEASAPPLGELDITSTTTLYLDESSARLRMWNIGSAILRLGFRDLTGVEPGLGNEPPVYGHLGIADSASVFDYVCYIDSADSASAYAFTADNTAASSYDTTETAIPATRTNAVQSYEVVNQYTDEGGNKWGYSATHTYASFTVWYKDPCVVEVPSTLGGGYLMILNRHRRLTADGGTMSDLLPGRSLADIVCYWSNNSTFSGSHGKEVFGPFLLAHTLSGLVDPELALWGTDSLAAFRLWLGVPGAVFVGEELYLYYVVRPNVDGRPDEGRPSYGDDAASDAERDRSIAGYNNGEGFTAAIVFRRFLAATVASDIVGATGTPEADWTVADTIRGLDSRPIRTWVAVPFAPGFVRDFSTVVLEKVEEARLAEGASSVGRVPPSTALVDPAPIVCGDYLRLFVAVRPNDTAQLGAYTNTLFGVWGFRAIDPSTMATVTDVDGGSNSVTYGRDFVVADAAASMTNEWVDQVSESLGGATATDYMDPDPVYIAGEWRVYTNDQTALVYFSREEPLVCVSADAAWERSDAPPALEVQVLRPRDRPLERWAGFTWVRPEN